MLNDFRKNYRSSVKGNAFALMLVMFACSQLLRSAAADTLSGIEDVTDIASQPAFVVRSLLSASRCTFPSYSPDDRTVAFVSDMTGRQNIWTVPRDGGWPNQITAMDADVIGLAWSPTDDNIAFLSGAAQRRLYIISGQGTLLREDGNPSDAKEEDAIGGWAKDGKLLLLARSWMTAKRDVCFLDVANNKTRTVYESDAQAFISDVTADHKTGLLSVWQHADDNDLYLLDFASGKKTLLTPHSGKQQFNGGGINRSVACFAENDKAVYCVVQDAAESRFARIKLKADKTPAPIELLAAERCYGFQFDDAGSRAIICFRKGFEYGLSLWNSQTGKVEFCANIPGSRVGEIAFSHGGNELAFSIDNWFGQSDIWLFDLSTKQFKQLTHASHPGVDTSLLLPPLFGKFQPPGGEEVEFELYKPLNVNGPAPFVIDFGSLTSADAQALSLNGIGVLYPRFASINSRVHDQQFYKTWTDPVGRKRAIATIKGCVDYLVDKNYAKPGHIGVMGHSYNGYMTWVALTELPDLFAAGVPQSAISDLRLFLKTNDPLRAKGFEETDVSPEVRQEHLELLSPATKADKITAAVLIEHGTKDIQVAVQDSDQMYDLLKKRGADVTYLRLEGEGHGFFNTKARVEVASNLVDFLTRHLQ